MNIKIRTARLSIMSNTLLILLKLVVGIVSGSVSILSEAIHSSMDLIAAVIAFFSVRISDKPADEDHPFGHGKFENVSGVIEAVLIFVAAAWIIIEAVKKISGDFKIESLGLASLVMFISAGVNLIVSRRLYKVSRLTDSIALEADALHLKTDVYTSLGVGTGMLLIWITGWHIYDPIIAILVALFIIKESWELLSRAYSPLLDTALSRKDLDIIDRIISKNNIRYHSLKTRKAGNFKFIELHIEMSPETTLSEVHEVCDNLENAIKKEIVRADVQIHAEPLFIHDND